jgi:hypothetical protein
MLRCARVSCQRRAGRQGRREAMRARTAAAAARPHCHCEGERVRPSGLDDRENLAVPPVGAGSSRRRAAPARRSHPAGGGEVVGGGSPSPLNRIATSDHTATMRRGAGSPHSCHDSQGGGRGQGLPAGIVTADTEDTGQREGPNDPGSTHLLRLQTSESPRHLLTRD